MQLSPLVELFELKEAKKACTLGLVVDCTAPYSCSFGMMLKVKLIDHTLNQEVAALNQLKQMSFCTVFIYAKQKSLLPRVTHVGQILYLRRADFGFFNGLFQGKLPNREYSSWVLFGPNPLEPPVAVQSNSDLSKVGSYVLDQQVQHLQNFAFNYFGKYRLSLVNQFKNKTDFDHVFRVKSVQRQEEGYTLLLTDGRHCYCYASALAVSENDCVKLRGIVRLSWDATGVIRLHDNIYSKLMIVGQWMKDACEFGTDWLTPPDPQREFGPELSQRTSYPLRNPPRQVLGAESKPVRLQQKQRKSQIVQNQDEKSDSLSFGAMQEEESRPEAIKKQLSSAGQLSFGTMIKDQYTKCPLVTLSSLKSQTTVCRVKVWVVTLLAKSMAECVVKLTIGGSVVRLAAFRDGIPFYYLPLLVSDNSLQNHQVASTYIYLLSHDGEGNDFFQWTDPFEVKEKMTELQDRQFGMTARWFIQHTHQERLIEFAIEPLQLGQITLPRIIGTRLIQQ